MKLKKFKIFFVSVFIFFLSVVPVYQAQAVIPVKELLSSIHLIVDKVFHGLSIAGQTLTNFSLGVPGAAEGKKRALRAVLKACASGKKLIDAANTADNFDPVTVLGGDATKIALLTKKITTLVVYKTCMEIALEGNENLLDPDVQDILIGNRTNAEVQMIIDTTQIRIDTLDHLRDQAVEQMWKNIAQQLVLTAEGTLTTNMVNKMIDRYAIRDPLSYASAAGAQVYSAKVIKDNYEDLDYGIVSNLTQNNGLADTSILPAVRMKAENNLGFDPNAVSLDDPDFYALMSKAGSGRADPYMVQVVMKDDASRVSSLGLVAGQQEVASGGGFMPARSCSSAKAQAKQTYEKKFNDLSEQVELNRQIYLKLYQASISGTAKVDPDTLQQAKDKWLQAEKTLQEFSDKTPPELPCGAVENPGGTLQNFTSGFMNAHWNAAKNPNVNNLPFFAKFGTTVVNNFVGKILNRSGRGAGLTQFTEIQREVPALFQSTEVTAGVPKSSTLDSAYNLSQQSAVIITSEKISDAPSQYKLSWTVSEVVQGAAYVRILSPSNLLSPVKTLNDNIAIYTTGGTYKLNIYNANNEVIRTEAYTIIPDTKTPAINVGPPAGVDEYNNLLENVDTPPNLDTSPTAPPVDITPDTGGGLIPETGTGTIITLFTQPLVAGVYTNRFLPIRGPLRVIR